jgi:hypothetical protein
VFHPRLAAQPLDGHDVQQVVDLRRQRAEAVHQFGGEGIDLRPVHQIGEAAVEAEPQARSAT